MQNLQFLHRDTEKSLNKLRHKRNSFSIKYFKIAYLSTEPYQIKILLSKHQLDILHYFSQTGKK